MSRQVIHIIGISDDPSKELSGEAMDLIAGGRVFSGGKRHHELVARLLPEDSEWIEIRVPLNDVFTEYSLHPAIIVFASGDPLFYGFASTVMREMPDAEVHVYPYFNSLQMLAHRLLLPYQDMRSVSLTGRLWKGLDTALIQGEKLIGVLTDSSKTPDSIARRMLQYGYDNYEVSVGESLGNGISERVRTMTLADTVGMNFRYPNCVILRQTSSRQIPFGIPDSSFALLEGRTRMITKMPVRLAVLSMLDLGSRNSFWDIGFCTGSVSIEAKLRFPHLDITAFEKRPQGMELMTANSIRFGTPGITAVEGDFMELSLDSYPRPDAVFIGGHGGLLAEMIGVIDKVLMPGGVIVFNSVSEQSQALFAEGVSAVGRKITGCIRVAVDDHNPIEIMKAE
ncbi:MAG: precorrin-6y C5,15-methyltransferase (decarboxylating) subunit CbiE [Bacteroidaceae bacterium]|nr:precorrin-6y C5,15-methyltransferase (decarboxylating) subunit CbiE [Bacteroidaceae bacterium]